MLTVKLPRPALFLMLLVPGIMADSKVSWRGFSSADGLRESYCSRLSVGPSGRVFIIHGHTDKMSIMDGYATRQIPVPGVEVKVKEGSNGELWAFAAEGIVPNPSDLDERQKLTGLQRYSEKEERWEAFSIPEIRASGIGSPELFLPQGEGIVDYLLPDRLMEFNARSRSSRVLLRAGQTGLGAFIEMQQSAAGGIWIGGKLGLGHYNPLGEVPWKEYLLTQFADSTDVHSIRESRPGLIYATVRRKPDPRLMVIRLKSGRWEKVVETVSETVGWEAEEGGCWLVQGAPQHFTVTRFDGYSARDEERIKALSGTLRQTELGPGGTFWIATNISAARHASRAWRTPPVLADFDSPVASMAEDAQGTLYFVSYDRLLALEGGRRVEYPYPAGIHADLYQQSGTCWLEDGRLTIATSRISLLTFDPRRHAFQVVEHPDGQRVRALGHREAGGLYVALYQKDSANYRLAYYYQGSFHEILDLKKDWKINHLRAIAEAGNGAIWMGGAGGDGLGVFQGGGYRTFTAQDGYTAGGSYAIFPNMDGTIWFGERTGVLQYDGKKWEKILDDIETVRWIMRSRDGSIWIASGSGLHRFYRGSWVTLGAQDGLPDGGLYYVFEDSRGRIWNCGTRGVSQYHPEADLDPPRTYVPEDRNVHEMPPHGDVRLVFEGIDRWNYTERNRLLYSYRLDSGDWSPFRQATVAAFRRVPAGEHTFEVRAMDRNWNIDPTPAVFHFKVLLPWYREAGFLALLAGTIFLACILVVLHFQRHVGLAQLVATRTHELTAANENLRLEIENRERTAEEKQRLEEQYRQAQKMDAIGRLSGGVAHDFNNLLTVINGYGDLALESAGDDAVLKDYLQEIQNAGQRAAALTRQLLAFSRKQVLQPIVISLNAAVHESEAMFRRVIGENIELRTSLAADLGCVLADAGQVQQVLMNLVVNARDAMPDGGRLTVETRNLDVDDEFARMHRGLCQGRYIMLSVADTGIGMDEQTQEHIFEPFFTTKQHGKGTGLGLSMVFGIAKQSGGYVWVESAPASGSRFFLLLPRTSLSPAAPAPAAPAAAKRSGTETILVVEDQREVRRLACAALRKSGYKVLEAANGLEAISVAGNGSGPIQLLVTDVVMPGMSGREVAAKLREMHKGIKVLFMSGYTDDVAVQSRVAGKEDFLQKPFAPASLTAKVRDILDASPCSAA